MTHDPRHEYDCERCKFSWCCGYLCACVLREALLPLKELAAEVERLQEEWRQSNAHYRADSKAFGTTTAKIGTHGTRVVLVNREAETGKPIMFREPKDGTEWETGRVTNIRGSVVFIERF